MNRNMAAYDLWSTTYDVDPNPQTLLEQSDVLRLVAPQAGEYILDAACGTGRYCRLFQEKGAYVTGIDFSNGMLQVARKQMPYIEFLCHDLTKDFPFRDESFDKVNCAQAFKHLPDIRRPVSEFTRILKPLGTITFSVTHPEMNWEGYELSFQPSFILSAESDIYPHKFQDYFEAIDCAGLQLSAFCQVPISEKIQKYLTPDSFQKVKGRFQIAIFQAVRKN